MDNNTILLLFLLVVAGIGYKIFKSNSGSKKRLPGKKPPKDKRLDKMLSEGRYGEAARQALEDGRHEEAIDFYLRARNPARAAQVAAQLGDSRRAAELYEKAGMDQQAADHYERAGMYQRAAKLRGEEEAPPDAETALSLPDPANLSGNLSGTLSVSLDLPDSAEELLAKGDIRGAAEAYKEAGHYDEAIHLYVNVLGMPGEAAPLVKERGNHERAAELYEMAGELEAAADSWISIAQKSDHPETFVDRIQRLSDDKAHGFLEEQTKIRPLADKTAELHYQLGLSWDRRGQREQAIQIFITIRTAVGSYRDVGTRLEEWQSAPMIAPPQQLPPPAAAPAAPQPPPAAAPQPPPVTHAVARVTIDPIVIEAPLEDQEVVAVALEAANSAQRQVVALSTADLTPVVVQATAVSRPSRTKVVGVALAEAEVSELLYDSAVQAARAGPSVSKLLRYVEGQTCELNNIEVFYRLGLAYLGAGAWPEAVSAFKKVEEASPGYRDALARADEIERWQGRLAPKLQTLGVAGTMIRKPESNRYTLQGELGRGGMAVVYRGRDEVLGREVALKFLAESMLAHAEARDLFQREARSVAQLNHPNVVTIYDFGTLEGRTFIAMEYVEGVTVKDMLDQRGKLPVMESLQIIIQLLDALEYAHEQSIIHRDIKASNVMVTSSGLVKLMDFGLAKTVEGQAQASMIAGTPAYMPPEQMGGGTVDVRTDLFAVGVTLYEMLAGQLPFKHLDRSPPAPLKSFSDTIPRMLEEIVTRAIALEPADRFQKASTFRSPLEKIRSAVGDRATGDLRTADLPNIDILPSQIRGAP